MKFKINVALIIAGVPALLFSWGAAYWNGYLLSLSLNQSMMEKSFYLTIFQGLTISYEYIFFMPIFVVSGSIITMGFFYINFKLDKYLKTKTTSNKFSNYNKDFQYITNRKSKIKIDAPLEFKNIYFKSLMSYSLVTLAFLFFNLIFLAHFERKGSATGISVFAQNLAPQSNIYSLIKIKIEGKFKTLTFLGCGSKNCAGIERGTNSIYYFTQSNGYIVIQ